MQQRVGRPLDSIPDLSDLSLDEGKSWRLDKDWVFRQSSTPDNGEELVVEEWLDVAQFPTNIHLDLIKHNIIKDPFLEKNELLAEWIGEKSWLYRNTFTGPSLDKELRYLLTFKGLDTFATVLLNGKQILESDNMFLSYTIDVSTFLQYEEQNEILIHFDSALLRAREIKAKHPDHKWLCWNGESARLAVRKAQYHWSWDWGPFLMTCGPWKEVYLEGVTALLTLKIDTSVTEDHNMAIIKVNTSISGASDAKEVTLEVSIADFAGFQMSRKVSVDDASVVTLAVPNPKLWYPHGYGDQPLYVVTAELRAGNTVFDKRSKRIGIRTAELVQQKDKHGSSFYFRINGIDVYCGGSNWIPGDSFLPRMSKERYKKWLELLVCGNQTMVRVWGGGIYEDEAFYNICDDLGILVWQDFMFGCGNYPVFDDILQSIKDEATQNIRRLRHHPCIIVYAGNNEDYQLAETNGLTYNYVDKNVENWKKTDFPARYIYEKLLPDIVKKESNSIYHPGSPWSGGGKKTTDPTAGDMHQWNVWHGTQEKYQVYEKLGGRFNSEFGMEGFPHIQTIDTFLNGNISERYQQSSTVDFHNKAAGHERRIATYMVENFRTVEDFEGYIHLSQLVQSEAMAYAYRGWRKQWGDSRHCGGALVWQLNDCWPAISWSIVDYYLRKKPAYYTIARALAPIAVGIQRQHWDWSESHARPPAETPWEAWIVSSKLKPVKGKLKIRFISIETGKDISEPLVEDNVEILPNSTTGQVFTGVIDNQLTEPHILAAILDFSDGGGGFCVNVDWPQPLKYLSFEDRGLQVKFSLPEKVTESEKTSSDASRGVIIISAKKPVKGLVFEERIGVRIFDSAIDVLPGLDYKIVVDGLFKGDKELSWRYLGM